VFDYMLTKEQLKIRDEVRELVRWVPKQMIGVISFVIMI
jgi:butyryl-CoA dehydrogenase